ncbi:uncharacterized protein LOC131636917 [Vicia villosa]|uniref:uncharacterized protein LOC131636917 n=1 Tax=Vicia villosa TaxID=3911 RepID=UPI00273AC296|nr:uncharacterized protein LOC131636917 [Vicia villosa]
MDVAMLFPEALSPAPEVSPNLATIKTPLVPKTFASIVSNNVCDIPFSQLPQACVKGDRLAITIPEEEYKLGVEACKHHLHGRVVWSKGATPLTVVNLKSKLMTMWPSIEKWGITSLGKGFFEFAFSSLEDVQRVRSVSTWSLPQGILKLFPWTKDFTPATLKQTSAQVWIRIHGLSQEYWRPRILFAIASSVGTPICIDSASNKSAFERPFGHFVRVLVDLDMTKELSYKILVERIGFAFFVDIEYEKLPDFCTFCCCIGHSFNNCKRKEVKKDLSKENEKRNGKDASIPVITKNTESDKVVVSNGTNPECSNPLPDVVPPRSQLAENQENGNTEEGIIVVSSKSGTSNEEDNKSESEYVDATQVVEFVPETQIDPAHKAQVTNFLRDSWDNMAENEKDDDNGVDLFPDKDFQLVLNKKRRNKKALSLTNTRLKPSTNNLSL